MNTDPYTLFPGRFKATGQDLEVWIRHCLAQYWLQHRFRVAREDHDETGKRFRLLFFGKFMWSDYESPWGIAEIIEWSNDTAEILYLSVWTPPDWEPKFHREKKTGRKVLEERLVWLEELRNNIFAKFRRIDPEEPAETLSASAGLSTIHRRKGLLGSAEEGSAGDGNSGSVPSDRTQGQGEDALSFTKSSDITGGLNKLAILWAHYNQSQRISKADGMEWFLGEYSKEVGLEFVSVGMFKKHLPKAFKNGLIDKDPRTGRFIPKQGT